MSTPFEGLLAGLTSERATELVGELSLNQLMGLVFARARLEKQKVTIRVRPVEARVRVKGQPPAGEYHG